MATYVAARFPLYHGTCTLFLESIAQHGLGGWDPIKEWRVLECLHKLIPIAEKNRHRSLEITKLLAAIEPMARQVNAGLNFQHGAVYLSPSRFTAVRYATGKKKGSELISYTTSMLDELGRLDLEEVKQGLFQEFPNCSGCWISMQLQSCFRSPGSKRMHYSPRKAKHPRGMLLGYMICRSVFRIVGRILPSRQTSG